MFTKRTKTVLYRNDDASNVRLLTRQDPQKGEQAWGVAFTVKVSHSVKQNDEWTDAPAFWLDVRYDGPDFACRELHAQLLAAPKWAQLSLQGGLETGSYVGQDGKTVSKPLAVATEVGMSMTRNPNPQGQQQQPAPQQQQPQGGWGAPAQQADPWGTQPNPGSNDAW